jgi:hypothetical protein
MAQPADRILEGVQASEVASLQALAEGGLMPARRDIASLHAKGWVDMLGNVPVITITGRTLLDASKVGFAEVNGQG